MTNCDPYFLEMYWFERADLKDMEQLQKRAVFSFVQYLDNLDQHGSANESLLIASQCLRCVILLSYLQLNCRVELELALRKLSLLVPFLCV